MARKIWSRKSSQDIDALTTQNTGVTASTLMLRAAQHLATYLTGFPLTKTRIIVLAGPGNNGGDGILAATLLLQWGWQVEVCLLYDRNRHTADASLSSFSPLNQNTQRDWLATGGKLHDNPSSNFWNELVVPKNCQLVVLDALFGIGFKGEITATSPYAQHLQTVHRLKTQLTYQMTVVAVDIPSGMQADSSLNTALLPADATVTFGGRKFVHVAAPGCDACGRVTCVDIGFDQNTTEQVLSHQSVSLHIASSSTKLSLRSRLRDLPASAHKFDRGHVLICGGSAGKSGAPILAAQAALRSGAGWVSITAPQHLLPNLSARMPAEITHEELYMPLQEQLDAGKLQSFITKRKVKVIVIGPGAISTPLTQEVVDLLCRFSQEGGFVVLDAGACLGLFDFKFDHDTLPNPQKFLLTPHPGEWLKLIQTPSQLTAIHNLKDLESAHKYFGSMNISAVYKSATPIAIIPYLDACTIFTDPFAGLGRAGSGDVYAGILASHGALGYPAHQACQLAYEVLKQACLSASTSGGSHSVIASDIIKNIGPHLY